MRPAAVVDFVDQGQEQVLDGDVLVLEPLGLALRGVQHAGQPLGDENLAAAPLRARHAGPAGQLGAQRRRAVRPDLRRWRDQAGDEALGLVEQSEQQVLAVDFGVAVAQRYGLRRRAGLPETSGSVDSCPWTIQERRDAASNSRSDRAGPTPGRSPRSSTTVRVQPLHSRATVTDAAGRTRGSRQNPGRHSSKPSSMKRCTSSGCKPVCWAIDGPRQSAGRRERGAMFGCELTVIGVTSRIKVGNLCQLLEKVAFAGSAWRYHDFHLGIEVAGCGRGGHSLTAQPKPTARWRSLAVRRLAFAAGGLTGTLAPSTASHGVTGRST